METGKEDPVGNTITRNCGGCVVKEYKVITVKSPEDAEKEMNHYALEDWEVKDVTFWETAMSYRLVITLERDKKIV